MFEARMCGKFCVDGGGVDGCGFFSAEAEQDGAVGAVSVAGESERAVKLGADGGDWIKLAGAASGIARSGARRAWAPWCASWRVRCRLYRDRKGWFSRLISVGHFSDCRNACRGLYGKGCLDGEDEIHGDGCVQYQTDKDCRGTTFSAAFPSEWQEVRNCDIAGHVETMPGSVIETLGRVMDEDSAD